MTQLEILELAYDAALQKMLENKKKADKAIAEGRPAAIAMSLEAQYREKMDEIMDMIAAEESKAAEA